MLPSSTQSLILALKLRGTALHHDRPIAKQKTGWHKESGRMEATATTTHIGGNIRFQKWGGRQMCWMLSRQRREIQSITHSQPRRSGKEGVDYACRVV